MRRLRTFPLREKKALAPVFVPPPFTWTGFYVGVNAGGVWTNGGNASTTVLANGVPIGTIGGVAANLADVFPGSKLRRRPERVHWRRPGRLQPGRRARSCSVSKPTSTGPPSADRGPSSGRRLRRAGLRPQRLLYRQRFGQAQIELGSTRGRVGYAFFPDNPRRSSSTGTGGIAYGGASSHLDVFDAGHGFDFSSSGGSSSRVGWTIGGGVEYAFTNNWIIGAEYLYYDLGNRHLNIVQNAAASDFLGATVFSQTKISFSGSVARARISYKF